MQNVADWVARIRSGERRAIARAISAIENATSHARELTAAIGGAAGHSRVIGITGPPGAGKSTLVNALAKELLGRQHSVAVIAVDPSSPLTGGAVLGDRVRLGDVQADERMFIRSLATRGHLGGLTRNTRDTVDVLDAAGFDIVIVETVGAGQSEVEIAGVAQTRLVVCPPGLGDEIQALKAGILEIADIFVVNKADLPDAERTEQELRAMLALRHAACRPPVLKTVATTGEGVATLVDEIFRHTVAERQSTLAAVAAERPDERDATTLIERLATRDRYMAHLGLELTGSGDGSATVQLRVRPEHINFFGVCHGGAIFSLADMALGLACNSHGTVAALIDAHMTFSIAVAEGELLTTRAVETSRTKKLAVYRMDVTREDGALVASLTGTVYRTTKPLRV